MLRGAALFAYDPDLLQGRRCKFTFGIDILDDQPSGPLEGLNTEIFGKTLAYHVYDVLLKRGDPVPAKPLVVPYVVPEGRRNIKEVELTFYRGDQRIPGDNELIGVITLPLPPKLNPKHQFEVHVYVGLDGVIYAYAKDPKTGSQSEEIRIGK